MNFVRIGDEGYQFVINLALVIFAELTEYDGKGCVALYFAGNDWPVRIFAGRPGYTDLLRWMDNQTVLTGDKTWTKGHPSDCDCFYCSAGMDV